MHVLQWFRAWFFHLIYSSVTTQYLWLDYQSTQLLKQGRYILFILDGSLECLPCYLCWRHAITCTKLSSVSMYQILNKYFTSFELLAWLHCAILNTGSIQPYPAVGYPSYLSMSQVYNTCECTETKMMALSLLWCYKSLHWSLSILSLLFKADS